MVMVFLSSLTLSVRAQEEKAESSSVFSISRDSVAQALANLTADGTYKYESEQTEDPSWLIYIQNWLKRVDDMWNKSPIAGRQATAYSTFGVLLVIILGISALALVLTRFFGGGRRQRQRATRTSVLAT